MLQGAISMFIYKSTRALPYVYLCQEKNSPYFYIGYRYANYLPSSEDFGVNYFTSNKYVRENFDNFDHTIVAEFFDQKSAYQFESQLIKELNSEFLINIQRLGKLQGKKYTVDHTVDNREKICALPGCNKIFTNWRSKCCCTSHSKKYAGSRSRS
jgi:hypothetical protein